MGRLVSCRLWHPTPRSQLKAMRRTGRSVNISVAGEIFPKPTYVACLEMNLPDGYLAPQDIAERLRDLQLGGRAVGVAYGKDSRRLETSQGVPLRWRHTSGDRVGRS